MCSARNPSDEEDPRLRRFRHYTSLEPLSDSADLAAPWAPSSMPQSMLKRMQTSTILTPDIKVSGSSRSGSLLCGSWQRTFLQKRVFNPCCCGFWSAHLCVGSVCLARCLFTRQRLGALPTSCAPRVPFNSQLPFRKRLRVFTEDRRVEGIIILVVRAQESNRGAGWPALCRC